MKRVIALAVVAAAAAVSAGVGTGSTGVQPDPSTAAFGGRIAHHAVVPIWREPARAGGGRLVRVTCAIDVAATCYAAR